MSQFAVGQVTIPLFIGTLVNWALSGVLAVQLYLYFHAFPKDRPLTKILVALVCLVEIVQTMANTFDNVVIFGSDWGNLQSLDTTRWGWFSVPVLGALVASVGQNFFAWRIYIIGRTLYIPLSIFQLGAGIWTGVDIVNAGKFSVLQMEQPKVLVAWLAVTAASDLIIVAGTVFVIMKARQTEFKSPATLAISRIIKVSVETGLVCALFAVADLAIYVTYDANNYHMGICIFLSKVYSNSMLLILNSRAYIGHADPRKLAGTQATDMIYRSRMTALHATTDVEAHSAATISSSTQIDLSHAEKITEDFAL
ncbi:hypothetical protein DFH06DRAFT_1324679 [Mycena polygramma]|nr:hypothetical protein DFH06DRAFT_1324679 [Mycena polygramma]